MGKATPVWQLSLSHHCHQMKLGPNQAKAKPRRWKSMLTHQGWLTVLYTLHLLASQGFEFLFIAHRYSLYKGKQNPLILAEKLCIHLSERCEISSLYRSRNMAVHFGTLTLMASSKKKVQNPAARTGVIETNTHWA